MLGIFTKLKIRAKKWLYEEQTLTIREFKELVNIEDFEGYDTNGNLKFVGKANVNDYEIEGPHGYVPIKKLLKTVDYDVYTLTLEDGKTLDCADEHIVMAPGNIERYAKDLKVGDEIITKEGTSFVQSVKNLGYQESMYDFEIDHPTHVYYTNDILSHNTTVAAGYLTHFSLFNSNKMVAILANKAAQANEILSRVTLALENIPFFLQPGCRELNKKSIAFSNRSKIIAAATSSSSIRGQSISLLYLDEFAFIQNEEEFYESTYPVITSGKKTKVIITTTPNGARGLFHRLWKESIEGLNDYVRMKVEWWKVPGRDDAWAEETKRNIGGDSKWRQEYCCEFLSSSGALISARTIEKMISRQPVKVLNDIDIYEMPEVENQYVITVDTAHGVGKDYSFFSVFDVTEKPYSVVAKYRDNEVSPLLYPSYISYAKTLYNDCPVLVENNDIGIQTANILHYDLEQEEILKTKANGRRGLSIGGGKTSKFGVRTTPATKSIGCANLKTLIEEDYLTIPDQDIQAEIGTFVAKGKSYEADDGCHDDGVMSLVLFAWMTTTDWFKQYTDESIRQDLASRREFEQMQSVLPGPITDTASSSDVIVSHGEVWQKIYTQ